MTDKTFTIKEIQTFAAAVVTKFENKYDDDEAARYARKGIKQLMNDLKGEHQSFL